MSDRDPAFDEWVRDAQEASIVDTAQAMGVVLKKAGRDWVGQCPKCMQSDSSFVLTPGNASNKQFMCRPAGVGGGVVSMVAHIKGVEAKGKAFVDICRDILQRDPPGRENTYQAKPRSVEREEREERMDKALSLEILENDTRERKIAKAQEFWAKCLPIAGTHAHAYLKRRKVNLPSEMLSSLRFLPACEYWGTEYGDDKLKLLGSYPCMVAAFQDENGVVTGIHRTYLDPEHPVKLRPPGDDTNLAKKMDGVKKGSAIYLGPIRKAAAAGEGIESVGSWYSLGLGPEDICLIVAGDLGNLTCGAIENRPHPRDPKKLIASGAPDPAKEGMRLPATIESLILLGDADSDPWQTYARLLTMGRLQRQYEREVSFHIPPFAENFKAEGDDWNSFVVSGKSPVPPILSLHDFEAHCVEFLKPPREARFGRVSYSEIRTLEIRPPDYIIADWMVRREQSFLAGEPGCGKSFLVTHAGLCVASGIPFLGRAVKQGLVIYLAAESGTGLVHQRIPAWMEHYGKSVGDIPFEVLTSRVDLYHDASAGGHIETLLESMHNISREWGMPIALVIIDTFNKVMPGGNENDGRDVSKVLMNMDRISRETGAHVCTAHHLPKAGGSMRGHGSLKGDVDTVALLSEDPQTKVKTMVFDKVKEGAKGKKFQFELLYLMLGKREDGEDYGSCVVLPAGKKSEIVGDAPIGFKLNDRETIFMECVFEAQKKNPEMVPDGLNPGRNVSAITLYDSVKRAYGRKYPFSADADDPDAIKKAKEDHAFRLRKEFESIQRTLLKYGVIQISDPFMWWTGKPLRAFPHTLPRKDNTPAPEIPEELKGMTF